MDEHFGGNKFENFNFPDVLGVTAYYYKMNENKMRYLVRRLII